MSQRPPPRPSAPAGRPGPALTPIAHSSAWQTAHALHAKALLPAAPTAEAFDQAAMTYWNGGEVEHTFTHANLALLRMAQAEEHHLAQQQANAALRQDLVALTQRVAALHQTLVKVGRVTSATRAVVEGASGDVVELLGALAEAWDSRPSPSQGRPARMADELDGPDGTDEPGGEDELVDVDEVDAAPSPARGAAGRAARYPQRGAPAGGVGTLSPDLIDDNGDEELVDVDDQGNPIEENQR